MKRQQIRISTDETEQSDLTMKPTEERKRRIDKAVKRVVTEYGDTLKALGRGEFKTTADERAAAYHHNAGFIPRHMLPHLDNQRKRKQAQVKQWLRKK